jgi:hypothetical protein
MYMFFDSRLNFVYKKYIKKACVFNLFYKKTNYPTERTSRHIASK